MNISKIRKMFKKNMKVLCFLFLSTPIFAKSPHRSTPTINIEVHYGEKSTSILLKKDSGLTSTLLKNSSGQILRGKYSSPLFNQVYGDLRLIKSKTSNFDKCPRSNIQINVLNGKKKQTWMSCFGGRTLASTELTSAVNKIGRFLIASNSLSRLRNKKKNKAKSQSD